MTKKKFKASLHKDFKAKKVSPKESDPSINWQVNEYESAGSFIHSITADGRAFTNIFNGKKDKEHGVEWWVYALDLEEPNRKVKESNEDYQKRLDSKKLATLEELKAHHAFFNQYAVNVYHTPNSTSEKNRLRVIFIGDRAVTNVDDFERIGTYLQSQFSEYHQDSVVKEASRYFYGTDASQFADVSFTPNEENRIPIDEILCSGSKPTIQLRGRF
ncbi:MAG TPA: hypothetical protein VLY03_04625 [Bacteroidota bacterium]|nr:hypothetical protein [Bacteroidota bacterium]